MTTIKLYFRSNVNNCTKNVPTVPTVPTKKHILINNLYVPYVYKKILERHAPIGINKKVGKWEQNLKTIDIKGLNTFPLCFYEGERCKKGERYAITA